MTADLCRTHTALVWLLVQVIADKVMVDAAGL